MGDVDRGPVTFEFDQACTPIGDGAVRTAEPALPVVLARRVLRVVLLDPIVGQQTSLIGIHNQFDQLGVLTCFTPSASAVMSRASVSAAFRQVGPHYRYSSFDATQK